MDEHQQDANSALMELDKGLRAHKVGEQCEAIVRFPSLFTRFPFPILINSAFLKLADTFRTGNNFMRLCIVRVAQQSMKHLDKILNVDEFMKRIYMVIHSNDPYARALTLRMLGSVSCIICEKKNAHHSIRQGLDSHDRIEQEAAIFATTQFASHSHNFASSICNKLSSMLQGLSTPLEVKLKLIPVMQHMHYDFQISSKARNILQDLLPSYPAQDFVLITLNTLTQLGIHSLVDIPEQVSLLLKYLKCDPREAIKSESLHNLNILAKNAPHLWSAEEIATLCEAFKLSTLSNSLRRGIIRVLSSLAESKSVVNINLDEGSSILQLCQQCCYDLDLLQAALAAKLYSSLIKFSSNLPSKRQSIIKEEAVDAIEALLLLLGPSSENNLTDSRALKIILSSLCRLCSACKGADSRVVKALLSLLVIGDVPLYSETSKCILETLAGVASTSHTSGLLSTYNSKLYTLLLTPCDDDSNDASSLQQCVKALLCTLLFISYQEQRKLSSNNRLIEVIEASRLNHWTIYRIARQACRMGQHVTACKLFTQISNSVASEQHYFWLTGLADIALAESVALRASHSICSNDSKAQAINNLTEAIQHYHQAITYVRAAVTPNHTLTFQCEYARLRCETLQAHLQLLNACLLVRSCPPPAISAMAVNMEGTSEESRSSAESTMMTNQMKQCANWFLAIEKSYSKLHLTSFDCDPRTLSIIDLLQQSCSIMTYVIDILVLSRSSRNGASLQKLDTPSENIDDDCYARSLKKTFISITRSLQELFKVDSTQPFSHLHTDCLLRCSSLILSVPHSIPRYFFQSLQTTNIKLAISPNPQSGGDHVLVEINQQLALKVEGVIQHEKSHQGNISDNSNDEAGDKSFRRSTFRRVDKIRLTMKKTKQNLQKQTFAKIDEGKDTLEQIVEPHNDYFSSQFLMDFPSAGIFNVVIETNVRDDQGVWWRTGPKETVLIKSYDDNARLQQQSTRSNRT